MMQTVLKQFPWMNLTSLALLIFFGFFIALLVITGLKSERERHIEAALVPLDDAPRAAAQRAAQNAAQVTEVRRV
jgi:hypothetical protein